MRNPQKNAAENSKILKVGKKSEQRAGKKSGVKAEGKNGELSVFKFFNVV